MKNRPFPIGLKTGNENAHPNKSQENERVIRIARATALLESTRNQFEKNVLEAKRGLSPESVGALAGPVARHK